MEWRGEQLGHAQNNAVGSSAARHASPGKRRPVPTLASSCSATCWCHSSCCCCRLPPAEPLAAAVPADGAAAASAAGSRAAALLLPRSTSCTGCTAAVMAAKPCSTAWRASKPASSTNTLQLGGNGQRSCCRQQAQEEKAGPSTLGSKRRQHAPPAAAVLMPEEAQTAVVAAGDQHRELRPFCCWCAAAGAAGARCPALCWAASVARLGIRHHCCQAKHSCRQRARPAQHHARCHAAAPAAACCCLPLPLVEEQPAFHPCRAVGLAIIALLLRLLPQVRLLPPPGLPICCFRHGRRQLPLCHHV